MLRWLYVKLLRLLGGVPDVRTRIGHLPFTNDDIAMMAVAGPYLFVGLRDGRLFYFSSGQERKFFSRADAVVIEPAEGEPQTIWDVLPGDPDKWYC